MKQRQLLTAKNKSMRLERCKAMLSRFTNGRHKQIVFSDEKLFTVQQVLNKQNHRILATDKSTLPESTLRISRTQKPASVMIWAGVTAPDRTPLIFIPQGVKINQSVYRQSILENASKPWAQSHFGNDLWVFQQDSAQLTRLKPLKSGARPIFPGVISSEEWPPCSPDLNPLDFSIWSILEERVNATPHRSVEVLKSTLLREWSNILDEHVCASVDSFIVRLKSCIKTVHQATQRKSTNSCYETISQTSLQGGMASLHPRSQLDRLLVAGDIGDKDVLYFPQEYQVSKNVFLPRMGKDHAGKVMCRCRVRL
ncbi:hypothetical protein LOD99_5279 [Oopsacas minuta]|uniref:DDE-1 domain-containing protein n=1 Tax=Oopsacas minuta TaxID=111878 RepID=A0AAV7JQQ1_9METZ|nr:hypothetical protein LOD99_5279 [Oopsacas minuta]